MAQVPDKVLSWLYSVLHEYHDAQRTYSDAARTLSAFPTLSPRTEVYTHEDGNSTLLLTLSGTIPVTFRGTIYRFPMKIWIPQAYPREAPMGYVTPGRDMVIRAGQHVGVDGRIYHPYLRDWGRMWDRASIAEFLEFLQQVFAKEPPVISKAQQQQYQRQINPPPPPQLPQQRSEASPAPPQLPPKQRLGSPEPAEMPSTDLPPPRPPKPGELPVEEWPQRTSSRSTTGDGPPPPPLPHERPQTQQFGHGQQYGSLYGGQSAPSQPQSYQNVRPSGPSQTHLSDQSRPLQQPYQPQLSNYDRSPVSPISPMNGYSELPENKYSRPPPLPPNIYTQQARQPKQPPPPPMQPHIQQQAQPPQPYQLPIPSQTYPRSQTYPPPQQPKKQQPPDLLSDPFDIALPNPSTSGPPAPAPPIPPNPEKEHLLHALSTTLIHQAQQKVNQNLSAIAPLQAQNTALRVAHDKLEAEIRQLEQWDATLASNETILHRSIQDCDRTILAAKSKPLPPIDEVLIAPTMVGNQLWVLCAEEAACREAMYVLQTGVDRGRVSGGDFVRQMRALGRECFLKMVVARKCARGLGLEV